MSRLIPLTAMLMLCRRNHAGCGTDFGEIPDPSPGAFEAAWEEDWQSNLFDAALERIKRRVREEHFQIFDLHVLRHWSARKVAETLDVNIAQVYLAKHRITALLRKEIRELEKRR